MKNTEENRNMHQWRVSLATLGGAAALFAATSGLAWAQASIRSITTLQQGGGEIVRIELSEALPAVPAGFTVQTPPRVAIDLPGVTNGLGRNAIEVNQGNVRSVSVAQGGDRTRLVLNLKQPSQYRAQLDGKALLLVLEAGGSASAVAAAPAAPAPSTQFAASQNEQALPLRDIDFRRGSDGAGRVVVNLASTQVGVDIRQQGQSLVVEFLRSSLPENLRRKLDVTDFGTPVQSVSTFQSGDRVRMVVDPRGAWEHSAYQTDTQFVLEVRPVRVDPNKLTQGVGFQGEKLSLNFQNIEVRALLQVIADFTNFNVVTSDTVTGSVTLRLKDVPWDQALDIILQSKGLGVRKNGNVLWVAPKEELNAKEQADLQARQKVAEIEPVRTQSFQLNYTKAEEVARSLTAVGGATGGGVGAGAAGASGRLLSPRGSVVAESRTNQLFVTDIPSKLEEVQAMITKIDIPVRQVLIEARIVEASDSFGKSLGVKLGLTDGTNANNTGVSLRDVVGIGGRVAIGNNWASIGSQTGQGGAAVFNDAAFVNLPAVGQGGVNPATFALSLFSATANRFLNLELSALEADGKGRIVSSPRVITADQVKALIEQGEELPYQAATSSGATNVQFKKANLKLEVVPQITPEGSVILDVDVNKDSVGRTTSAGFAIDTKHIKTQVLVENGGTVVIGGIYTQTETEGVNKVPVLGDVPVMGNLFKNRQRSTSKTELLVFITPKIVSERPNLR